MQLRLVLSGGQLYSLWSDLSPASLLGSCVGWWDQRGVRTKELVCSCVECDEQHRDYSTSSYWLHLQKSFPRVTWSTRKARTR